MAEPARIGALVPAAGRSRRMGRSKPLLSLGDTDFLGRILDTLQGLAGPAASVAPVVVIRRVDDHELAARLAGITDPALRVAMVDGAGDMLASVRAGAALLDDVVGALVWPVDAPAVVSVTVAALCAAARQAPHRVVVPVTDGQTGHPTYVPRALLDREPAGNAGVGLRGILAAAATVAPPIRVVVDDPFSLLNVNTPHDYQRLLEALRV
jgi:molybdenum cofactor cytidylyltransferase